MRRSGLACPSEGAAGRFLPPRIHTHRLEFALADPLALVDPVAFAPSRVRKPLARLIPASGVAPFVVETAVTRIGAEAAADLVIGDPTVAAMHATLHLQGGVWLLEDLGSDGGTWVDDEAVTESHPIAPGSAIRLGTVELIFDPQDTWDDSPSMAGSTGASGTEGIPPTPAPLFTIERAPAGPGWLPWVLVGAVVLVAIAAILLAGGSR